VKYRFKNCTGRQLQNKRAYTQWRERDCGRRAVTKPRIPATNSSFNTTNSTLYFSVYDMIISDPEVVTGTMSDPEIIEKNFPMSLRGFRIADRGCHDKNIFGFYHKNLAHVAQAANDDHHAGHCQSSAIHDLSSTTTTTMMMTNYGRCGEILHYVLHGGWNHPYSRSVSGVIKVLWHWVHLH